MMTDSRQPQTRTHDTLFIIQERLLLIICSILTDLPISRLDRFAAVATTTLRFDPVTHSEGMSCEGAGRPAVITARPLARLSFWDDCDYCLHFSPSQKAALSDLRIHLSVDLSTNSRGLKFSFSCQRPYDVAAYIAQCVRQYVYILWLKSFLCWLQIED